MIALKWTWKKKIKIQWDLKKLEKIPSVIVVLCACRSCKDLSNGYGSFKHMEQIFISTFLW